jgi:2-polyprenyl-6-methoxyphenol hydroxylase-like FAD-dependent oxidoreductase
VTADYDVIVVGARCAGSPLAMLLARKGYRTLVVDRATFPSDTVSTHYLHAPAVASLARWGLLDAVEATGCPVSPGYTLDFGPISVAGTARPVDGISHAYAPRRYLLDTILVEAAAKAGAEVREGFTVDEILLEDGRVTGIRGRNGSGTSVTERATVVVGADGANSKVARAVEPRTYLEKPPLQSSHYTYWSNLPVDGMEITIRPHRGWAALPTNNGLTLLVVGWAHADHAAYAHDVEGNYLKTLDLSPAFAERVRQATREERFYGAAVRNFFRQPYGPGWALVGDAGYTKDPITAQGIGDAFADAQRCAEALDGALAGDQTVDDAMATWHTARDAHAMPIYDFTTTMATLEPPPPELQQLLGAMQGNQSAMDSFVSVLAGTISPVEFFDPANLAVIAGAVAPAAR